MGDLPPYQSGVIRLNLLASCDAIIGQNHCIEATVTPNDPCPIPDDWTGANISLASECGPDSLNFRIINDGIAPQSEQLRYIVIEDGIMMMNDPVLLPGLGAGESVEVSVPANGSTYHLVTNQEPGNPGFNSPTIAVEGCGINDQGTFSTGMVNLFELGDATPDWYDILCRPNTGAFDPNDKMGLPIGVGERHFIREGTTITYDIRFQNTGTDTAINVVIRDTLAPEFDLNTLRVGVSSHDYTYTLDTNRVLTITYENIMLPDSNVDWRTSQGVISYTIRHVDGIAIGTELRNQAAIYFDFNELIFTSNTLHTIWEKFPTSINEISISDLQSLLVYPNPVSKSQMVNFKLPEPGQYLLEIYNNSYTFPSIRIPASISSAGGGIV